MSSNINYTDHNWKFIVQHKILDKAISKGKVDLKNAYNDEGILVAQGIYATKLLQTRLIPVFAFCYRFRQGTVWGRNGKV